MTEHPPTSNRFDAALAFAGLVTIATGGALIGLGLRDGEPSRVFRFVGRSLLERAGMNSAGVPLTAVALGYVHHLIIATAWGLLLGMLLLRLRGAVRLIAGITLSVGFVMIASQWLPPVLRIGFAVTSTMVGAVSVSVALLAAVLGGLWVISERHTR